MKTISLRQGFEGDHSTRDYGYISGVKVHYDYGTFDMRFTLPYKAELFKLFKKYKQINVEKEFNKIMVNLYLYCEDFNEDEGEYVGLVLKIRGAMINQELEIIKIIDAYHGQNDTFKKIKAKTELGKKLQKVLTACW